MQPATADATNATNTPTTPTQTAPKPPATPGNQSTQSAPTPGSQTTSATTPAVEPGATTAPAATPYTIKKPDGTDLSDSLVSEFAKQAEAVGVKQEDAQKLLERLVPATTANAQAERQAAEAKWQQALQFDPRFGGAANAQNVQTAIDSALERAGTPALRELLQQSGLDKNVDLQHLIYQAGLGLRQDGAPVRGQKPANAPERRDGMMTNAAAVRQMAYPSMQGMQKK